MKNWFLIDITNVRPDYPFEEDFEIGVFRHESGKWFALAMNIGERKLGHDGDEKIDVVNFKCAPEVVESLAVIDPGIYRAQLTTLQGLARRKTLKFIVARLVKQAFL